MTVRGFSLLKTLSEKILEYIHIYGHYRNIGQNRHKCDEKCDNSIYCIELKHGGYEKKPS